MAGADSDRARPRVHGRCASARHRLDSGLLHFPVNFQATSAIERAFAILEAGGLLSIKAHLLAESGPYRALDGLTERYRDHLDRVFCTIEDRFGDDLWWTSM